MSDDLLTMPGTLLAENEARHKIKPGCECLMCEQRRHLDAAFRGTVVRLPENATVIAAYGDTAQFECGALAAKEPWIDEPILVTLGMLEAAVAYDESDEEVEDLDYFAAIFRAMRALEPARDGDFQAMLKAYREQYALAVERAGEIAELRKECVRLADGPPTQHPPEYVAQVLMDREGRTDPFAFARLTEVIRCARLDGRKSARDETRAIIAAKDARIAELKSELAAFTIANAAPVVETETPHNPFRDFPTDPRRMGP